MGNSSGTQQGSSETYARLSISDTAFLESVPSRNLPRSRIYDAPASLEGLPQLLLGLAQDVLDDYTSEKIGSLYVISARFGGVGHFDPVSIKVLPIEPIAGTSPIGRSRYMDSVSSLVAETERPSRDSIVS